MKKILYILLIGLFASCDNLLDVEPETEVSFDNFYKTEQDLEITLYQMQSYVWRVGGAGGQAGYGGHYGNDILFTASMGPSKSGRK